MLRLEEVSAGLVRQMKLPLPQLILRKPIQGESISLDKDPYRFIHVRPSLDQIQSTAAINALASHVDPPETLCPVFC
jgi:hypothetical protein